MIPANKGGNKKNKTVTKCHEMAKGKSVDGTQSSITIYQNAVPRVNAEGNLGLRNIRKESSLSDELMETSDESPNFSPEGINPIGARFFADVHTGEKHAESDVRSEVRLGTSGENKEPTLEEHAEQMVLEAKRSRAQMYDVAGKHNVQIPTHLAYQQISLMDQDYQMIDAHIDDHLKRKIWAFEYIDLSHLLSQGRNVFEEEGQRLEII